MLIIGILTTSWIFVSKVHNFRRTAGILEVTNAQLFWQRLNFSISTTKRLFFKSDKNRNCHANMELKGILFHLIVSVWKMVLSFSTVFVLVFMETKANNLMFDNAVDDTFWGYMVAATTDMTTTTEIII